MLLFFALSPAAHDHISLPQLFSPDPSRNQITHAEHNPVYCQSVWTQQTFMTKAKQHE